MNPIKQKSVELLKEAKKIVVLSGAGMSTESGIPDFRSKKGLYNEKGTKEEKPEKILSHSFFFEKTERFYEFLLTKMYYPQARPNEGHAILAKWEKEGRLHHIVTQNIDGLHTAAGNQQVIEFHGTIRTATCYNPKCQKVYTIEDLERRKQEKKAFWECDCGQSSTKRYIKPDVVLYDEYGKWLVGKGFQQVKQLLQQADLVLVLGTGLGVMPFADLPLYRLRHVPVIIVNLGETPYDHDENVYVIKESIGSTLSWFDQELER